MVFILSFPDDTHSGPVLFTWASPSVLTPCSGHVLWTHWACRRLLEMQLLGPQPYLMNRTFGGPRSLHMLQASLVCSHHTHPLTLLNVLPCRPHNTNPTPEPQKSTRFSATHHRTLQPQNRRHFLKPLLCARFHIWIFSLYYRCHFGVPIL